MEARCRSARGCQIFAWPSETRQEFPAADFPVLPSLDYFPVKSSPFLPCLSEGRRKAVDGGPLNHFLREKWNFRQEARRIRSEGRARRMPKAVIFERLRAFPRTRGRRMYARCRSPPPTPSPAIGMSDGYRGGASNRQIRSFGGWKRAKRTTDGGAGRTRSRSSASAPPLQSGPRDPPRSARAAPLNVPVVRRGDLNARAIKSPAASH